MLHVAMAFDAYFMVTSDTRMYLRKQSLDQRPMLWMRYLGTPMAAAVDAAPMRSECEDMFAVPFVVLCNVRFTSNLVRYEPLAKMNRGP